MDIFNNDFDYRTMVCFIDNFFRQDCDKSKNSMAITFKYQCLKCGKVVYEQDQSGHFKSCLKQIYLCLQILTYMAENDPVIYIHITAEKRCIPNPNESDFELLWVGTNTAINSRVAKKNL